MIRNFETVNFRVQFVGRTVWIENCEGGSWVLRAQHPLPLPAVEDFDSDPRFVALASALRVF